MSENLILHSDPNGSNPPVGVDLLGQPGENQQQFNATDHSCRTLETVAHIRQALQRRGGQPR